MAARSLLPSHKPLLDFFRHALTTFQSTERPTPFRVVCTLTPHPAPGSPAQLLQHRILAPSPTAQPPHVPPSRLVVLDSSFNPPSAAHLRMAREAVLAEVEREGSGGKKGGGGVRLLLLLAVKNADKAAKPAGFEQRLAMMWAFARDVRRTLEEGEEGDARTGVAIDVALTTHPFFHAKSAAIAKDGFYKGTEVGGQRGGGEETEQVILAGYDTLIRIFDPKYYGTPSEVSEVSSAGKAPIRIALDPFFKRARLRVTMRTDDEWGGRDEQAAYLERLLRGDELEKIGGSREWAERIEMVDGRKEGEPVVSSTLAREAAKRRDWGRLRELVPSEVGKWIEREGLYADA
ncbi:Nicotinamide mononucleotide adenylyltransferase [Coniochaeta hoffmannii]|uniref:Nicotinamide mononucleotide adenylyltransferase n=1 Tax=Coniochaeta hoffmannii TaxID=91930 RepID=A0AA38S4L3_9PEZI|nr:Nicotinamide mononucleotide adenylyltransferase [Coniochaeta hoffmannii]